MKHELDVLYLTNIPSPYMVGYLNELGKYCRLKAVFEKEADSTRPDQWKESLRKSHNFEIIVLHGFSVLSKYYGDNQGNAPDDKALSLSVIKYLKQKYDLIIVGNPCTPTGIIAIIYMRLKHIPYTIQSEGGMPGSGKGVKERLKFLLMHKAEYYFSTCEMDDDYFITYGADRNKILRYPFASISEVDLPRSIPSEAEKRAAKRRLCIPGKRFILTVGRSVPVKGFDVLLKAIPFIKEKDITIGFVGGECLPEYKRIIEEKQIYNTVFVDNVDFSVLKEYYIAADVFVLPTRSDTWGLVINEAMTFGLPIITTNRCVAGNALVKEGKNGFIVSVEDSVAIAEKVNTILENKELSSEMGRMNYNLMREWTFEEMGKVMIKNIEGIKRIDEHQ